MVLERAEDKEDGCDDERGEHAAPPRATRAKAALTPVVMLIEHLTEERGASPYQRRLACGPEATVRRYETQIAAAGVVLAVAESLVR